MSNESDKIKHSRRLHQEEAAIKKQVKIAKTNGLTNKDIKEPHRLAKHHAMNCGDPKCVMCSNPRRTWNELTMQEKRLFQEMEIVRGRHSNGLIKQED
jgi:hypothetical protein